jgi:hypothetical protein
MTAALDIVSKHEAMTRRVTPLPILVSDGAYAGDGKIKNECPR